MGIPELPTSVSVMHPKPAKARTQGSLRDPMD